MQNTFRYHIKGLHCASCVGLTEMMAKELSGVTDARTSLSTSTIEITGDFAEKSAEDVAEVLQAALQPHGYRLLTTPETHTIGWREFVFALPIALVFIGGFIMLQKYNIVRLLNTSTMTYGTAFALGGIASVSTCTAVVGGVILSLSTTFAKAGEHIRPQLFFHVSRLITFFVLGGAIGALGSVFQLSATATLIISFLVAIVLLVLGINLLDITPHTKRFTLTLPTGLAKWFNRLHGLNHTLTPILVGAATFFLPCGFTQSMQLYTLTTGSFIKGAFTMLAFAVGTFPMLALLSFGSLAVRQRTASGIFFKTAGAVVIFFAIFNLLNTLALAGVIEPLGF